MSYADLYSDYKGFLDSLPEAHSLYDLNLRETWANEAAMLLRNRYEGENVDSGNCMVCNKAMSCLDCSLQAVADSGETCEKIFKSGDGTAWRIRVIPLRVKGKISHYLKISMDISSEIASREEVSKSRYLASLGELSAGVAHEINNPNGLVLMNLSMLKDVVRDAVPLFSQLQQSNPDIQLGGLPIKDINEELPQVINEMLDGSRKIKRIVEELKDFARGSQDNFNESVDVKSMLEKAIRMVQFIIEKYTKSFLLEIEEDIPLVRGNAQRLEQVIINLILNSCQSLSSKEQSIKVLAQYLSERDEVAITVTDEGRGIDRDHLTHLTDPFFTTRRNSGGTGLGLSVSARIIKEHEGEMLFESKPGHGTKATIKLPIV